MLSYVTLFTTVGALMLRDKRELAASVLDPTRTGLAEDWLADLSLDAVSELVALSADAVEGT